MSAWKVVVAALAFASVASTTLAQESRPRRGEQPAGGGERPRRGGGEGQPGGGREALAPEKAKAAWNLQAGGVAKRLNLSADQTTALSKAYADARESHSKAAEKLAQDMRDKMENSDDRRAAMADMQKAREDMNKAEREKFEKAIASSITGDNATKALASLGSFNRQWDVIVNTVASFNLEAAKQQEALNAAEDYVVALGKAPRPSGPDDREATRTATQEARTKLTDSMKKILSEEQFKTFEESFRPAGRRGGGGGQGGGGQGGRGERND